MIDDNEVEWRLRAACRDMPVNDFFPTRGTGGTAPNYLQAVRDACEACPVRQHCLDDAIHGEGRLGHPVLGYRGGKTPEQRVVILRGQGRRISERQAFTRSRRHLVARAHRAGVTATVLADAYNLSTHQIHRIVSGE